MNVIPGPNSTELALALGYVRAGIAGLLVAGVCFVTPAVLIILPLAWSYAKFGTVPEVRPVLLAINAAVLAKIDPGCSPPRSVRRIGVYPWRASVPAPDAPERMRQLVAGELASVDGGTVAVLCPDSQVARVRAAVEAPRVSVHPVRRAKGLEFDSVIVLDPDAIAAGARGHSDLYVAMTRSTRRLGLVSVDRPAG
jgi:hypothetical protein